MDEKSTVEVANGRVELMTEELKLLLYPLGYLSTCLFGVRFIIQWLQSEKKGFSVVTPIFWRLSLAGNFVLLTHSLIQAQYHVAIVQTMNGVIAWRNLDLMSNHQKSLPFTLSVMSTALILTTTYFTWFAPNWFSSPGYQIPLHFSWHAFGFIGVVLFSLRFLVQWWQAERQHQSELSPLFWWISLSGGVISLIYFLKLGDFVNVLGPAVGLIPYARNLMLIQKRKAA